MGHPNFTLKMRITLLCLTFALASSSCFSQEQNKRRIQVFCINFYTRTSAQVNCSEFLTAFKDILTFTEIRAIDSVIMLDRYLDSVNYINEVPNMDVRAKFLFRDQRGREITICTNQFDIAVNGNLVKKNSSFFTFLMSLVPKNQLSPYGRNRIK